MSEADKEASVSGKEGAPLSKKCKGDLSLWQEAVACITLGLLLAWYYIVVFVVVALGVVIALYPALRPYAVSALVLFLSTAWWPIDTKPWDWFCNSWLFWLWREYFYYEWVLEERVEDPTQRYLYAELPHGVFPFGQFISISIIKETLPGAMVLSIAASVLFRLPGLRHVFSWIGCRPASAKNVEKIYQEGGSCAITVGGVAEMFLINNEKEKVYLKKHRGFVREAIKHGADLVPVFCFGNSRLLKVVGENNKVSMGLLKKLSRRLQASIILFYGRWGLPIPLRLPLKFVIGKAIKVEQKPVPTEEDINALHSLFIERVQEIYEKHKPEWETRPLEVW